MQATDTFQDQVQVEISGRSRSPTETSDSNGFYLAQNSSENEAIFYNSLSHLRDEANCSSPHNLKVGGETFSQLLCQNCQSRVGTLYRPLKNSQVGDVANGHQSSPNSPGARTDPTQITQVGVGANDHQSQNSQDSAGANVRSSQDGAGANDHQSQNSQNSAEANTSSHRNSLVGGGENDHLSQNSAAANGSSPHSSQVGGEDNGNQHPNSQNSAGANNSPPRNSQEGEEGCSDELTHFLQQHGVEFYPLFREVDGSSSPVSRNSAETTPPQPSEVQMTDVEGETRDPQNCSDPAQGVQEGGGIDRLFRVLQEYQQFQNGEDGRTAARKRPFDWEWIDNSEELFLLSLVPAMKRMKDEVQISVRRRIVACVEFSEDADLKTSPASTPTTSPESSNARALKDSSAEQQLDPAVKPAVQPAVQPAVEPVVQPAAGAGQPQNQPRFSGILPIIVDFPQRKLVIKKSAVKKSAVKKSAVKKR